MDFNNPQDNTTVARSVGSEPFGLGDQIYSRLLRERIIFLAGEVRDEMANAICAQMLLLAAEDAEKDIYLYINSPGGSVTAGMAIYDTMHYIKNDVATVAMGMAASMGQFLLTAGAPGKRYATPNARILMHQPLGGIGGTATDIRIQAEQMAITKQTMSELNAKHTGQPLEKIIADSDRDISIYINSPGGSFTALTAIYDTMQFVRPDITTICLGQAASAAAIILAGGTKGKRYGLEHSRILIHQPSSEGGGQASDIEIQAREILRMRGLLETMLAKHSNKTVEEIEKDIERDKILTAAEAVEYGIIDKVMASRKAKPQA